MGRVIDLEQERRTYDKWGKMGLLPNRKPMSDDEIKQSCVSSRRLNRILVITDIVVYCVLAVLFIIMAVLLI